ncbi:MAG: hypothetical protein KME03_03990 [Aphanocapsa lilacina HA4352-LM1]|jgi:hypothetical protein|nr:hypothetical protein [Aphanocapsa lilacina HA4352-LM1]
MSVTFRPGLTLEQIEQTIDRTEAAICSQVPEARRIWIEAESLKPLAAKPNAQT